MFLFESFGSLTFLDFLQYPKIQIPKGKWIFLTGESGSGKSTLLKIFNRTLLPSQGGLSYKGKPIEEYPVLDYRKEILLVPQDVFLFDTSIQENFDQFYQYLGLSKPDQSIISSFLQLSNLAIDPSEDCSILSGGQRQRVFLSIYLSLTRSVLLLDEPTSALDEQSAYTLFSQLKKYTQEKEITVICVSHQPSLVQTFADTIIDLGGSKHD